MTRQKQFENQVVVITGAGSGIGRATATAFAQRGASVHLVDVNKERVEQATQRLRQRGLLAQGHVTDCADAKAMMELADAIYQQEGRVDILHNNAGVCYGGPVEKMTLEDWQWSMGTNLWSVIHGLTAFLPRMIAQKAGGTIINTASMGGLIGIPYVVPYCTTKFAVVGLSEALGAELAPHGICVLAVCPGMVRTNVFTDGRIHLPGNWQKKIEGWFGHFSMDPEEVAEQIVSAVQKKRSLLVAGKMMVPLWLTKRVSTVLYQRMAGLLTRIALRQSS